MISGEHTAHRWVDAAEFAAQFTDEAIVAVAGGDDRIGRLLRAIGADVARYRSLG